VQHKTKVNDMSINWVNDSAAVAIAASLGITAHEIEIKVSNIDRKLSAENRAREVPLDEGRLDGIRHSISLGIPIPKVVVRLLPDGETCVIAGGNHRFNSIADSVSIIPVHCAQCTDAEFEVLCRALNTVVGVGMTQSERVKAAVDAVERIGFTRKEAGKIYGVHETTLSYTIKKLIAERKVMAILPHAKNKMTTIHFQRLGDLGMNDNILKACAVFVDKSKADGARVQELAVIARTKATEAEQVNVFSSATAPYFLGKKIQVPRRKRSSFLSSIQTINKIASKKTWQSIEMDSQDIESVRQSIVTTIHILNCLCKAST